jgi:DNA-binding Xre family transcriptional regulator
MDTSKAIPHTVISFEPLRSLLLERGVTDTQLAKKIGEKVGAVRDIQLHPETTTIEIIRKICQELHCEPGDIMKSMEGYFIPAKETDANRET